MSSGALLRPSTCLRCQLREVILQTRPSLRTTSIHFHQQCRPFSSRRPLREEATTGLVRRVDHIETGRSQRSHIRVDASGERYVGKGKRRQKVVVESLPTKFLGTTQADSGVIVMQDANEEELPKNPASKHLVFNQPTNDEEKLSAQDIESKVRAKNAIPKQEDVYASIEALRVEVATATTIVDNATFEALRKKLTDRYTAGQLSTYLVRSLTPSTTTGGKQKASYVKSKLQELGTSRWRAGKTPISQRPSGVLKKAPSNKQQFAEKILRLSWWMTIETEEKEIGEIELHLQPWQVSLLFDLVSDSGRPYYESLVDSHSLVSQTSIEAHRPASIMRVTGRRRDAEEIVRRVNLELVNASRLEWSLKPHVSTPSEAGRGREASSHFRDEDVRYVARLTRSAIMFGDDGKVSIHSRMRDDTINARRLLLSLLPNHTATTESLSVAVEGAVISHSHAKNAIVALPSGPASSGLQRRFHNLDLVRQVKPGVADGEKNASNEVIPKALHSRLEKAAVTIAQQLDQIKRGLSDHDVTADSYWRRSSEVSQPDWKVNFRRLLQEEESSASNPKKPLETTLSEPAAPHPRQLIVQSTVPGIETALSYFSPLDDVDPKKPTHTRLTTPETNRQPENKKQAPFIMAYFTPAVSNPHSSAPLPSLAMSFHFRPSRSGSTTDQDLHLTSMIATTSEQRLSVPLPLFGTDIVFTRKTFLKAIVYQAMADKAIQNFVWMVQRSVRSKEGVLTAPAELTVRLPHWLVEGKKQGKGTEDELEKGSEEKEVPPDVPVNYIFERFEQIQAIQFVPGRLDGNWEEVDEGIRSVMEHMLRPKSLALDYREVEGGAIYGNSTTLSLRTLEKRSKKRRVIQSGRDLEASESDAFEFTAEMKSTIQELIGEQKLKQEFEQEELLPPHYPLVNAAFKMAHVLTRASAGTLKRMGQQSKEKK
ncbi:hypothetical protein TI39_contig615g00017 [Zymoseptoria brevis]|uniref:Mitochondrial inner-membrane-bound regulator-domain-containing protein n=1 Tax=Zymoseptoria brevis TaxID=1047168 RepID=A0A0F4GK44_9PEZI|nr:hypothetical protein TI39_contig615g00017 [Zymoseptoria brevis]